MVEPTSEYTEGTETPAERGFRADVVDAYFRLPRVTLAV